MKKQMCGPPRKETKRVFFPLVLYLQVGMIGGGENALESTTVGEVYTARRVNFEPQKETRCTLCVARVRARNTQPIPYRASRNKHVLRLGASFLVKCILL